jgi:membrane protein required for colicin V production
MFFTWLVPERSQPEWVRNAKSRVVLEKTGETIKSWLPEDPEGYLRRFKRPKDGEEPADTPPAETPPARPPRGANSGGGTDEQTGYGRADRAGMQQLLNAPAPKTR